MPADITTARQHVRGHVSWATPSAAVPAPRGTVKPAYLAETNLRRQLRSCAANPLGAGAPTRALNDHDRDRAAIGPWQDYSTALPAERLRQVETMNGQG
ncbi:hypothetical protein BN12_4060003 [Nostocoides japonicum T1-X7]|uniref:Uncharacterized protein n=1 Tax=Nostocoides japonicum T1-X7 TaxID=1194083 RepID=A0A077LZ72_9MICO|nr:hypothetical protein BN12_4060003 [Tetrasphaera japonica T1-X7]